ncbi:glycosyltransferase [Paenibacillus nanensis]|uniref:4,4'-diaponeurosporenoate glycosyltransferase n=1 Tax=Paenibacillus nanensis TaxID=393251 RepID=A0A3A1UP22_9BACL|nr:glycosyltransferase [Paenibacillus nanensis]RIX50308.1 glycosyltransferase [Paenibacillus nanensis]
MEKILILIVLIIAWTAGWILFRRKTVSVSRDEALKQGKLSVIIPARNEEHNLPNLLQSLRDQTIQPFEIIVVDDHSLDRTKAIAESFGVTVIESPELPPGWTGKNWAVYNGYLEATGDLIAFLDADVRLAPNALQALLEVRERTGGAISVVPYHETKRFYERLALIPCLLGVFAFTSPMERQNPDQGLYGACILVSREQYEQAGGHIGIKSELLDDLNLGAKFKAAGIPVNNYIGHGLVSFRMYPGGIRSEIEGFSKGAVLSTGKLSGLTTLLVAMWLIGLLAAEAAPFFLNTAWWKPLTAGYVLYTAQIYYFVRYTGRFGIALPTIHMLSSVFFIGIMIYSVIQVVFFGKVAWKGRSVDVGGRDMS